MRNGGELSDLEYLPMKISPECGHTSPSSLGAVYMTQY